MDLSIIVKMTDLCYPSIFKPCKGNNLRSNTKRLINDLSTEISCLDLDINGLCHVQTLFAHSNNEFNLRSNKNAVQAFIDESPGLRVQRRNAFTSKKLVR